MPLINAIQNFYCGSEKVPNRPTASELGFSFAIVIIGGAGAFLLATQTLTPLGITLTAISGTGALGLTASAIFRRCCGSPYEFAIEEEVPEGSSFNEYSFEEAVEDSESSESERSEESASEVSEKETELSQGIEEDAPDKVFAICVESLENPASYKTIVNDLIAHFKTLSLEEVQSYFALKTEDPAWFGRQENPNILPPRYVITIPLRECLIEEFSDNPEWIRAMFAGIDDNDEIGKIIAHAEFNDSARERMLQVLREDNKLFTTLFQLHPIDLSHIIAHLTDSECTALLSLLLLESDSTALATKEQIDRENTLQEEKIKWVIYRFTDNVWKSLVKNIWEALAAMEQGERSRTQLEEVLQLLANVSSNQFAMGWIAVLQQLDENLSALPNPKKNVVDGASRALKTLMEKLKLDREKAVSLGKRLLKEKVQESPLHFPGPLMAAYAVKLKIWEHAPAEEKNEYLVEVLFRINREDIRYIVPMLDQDLLETLLDLWKIEKFKPEEIQAFALVIKMNASIYAELNHEQRQKYYPGYMLVYKNLNTSEEYCWLETGEETTNRLENRITYK